MRFQDLTLTLGADTDRERDLVNLYPSRPIGRVFGFGGAFTDASAFNYAQLTPTQKREFLQKLFDKKTGAGYTFCRIPMGSCDFAREPYSEAYRADLSDFSIAEDKQYMIPMIRDALSAVGGDLFLFASPWSPPAFMKDTGELNGGGRLLPELYDLYALYFVKFIQSYAEEGIRISAVTVQNEAKARQTWESCKLTAEEEAEFAVRHLRPALDRAGLGDVKILIWDHNRERIMDRADTEFAFPGAKEAIWGLGFHWYSGAYFEEIDLYRQTYPDREILETELCFGASVPKEKRAPAYASEYLNCLRHGVSGICDWNMLLDAETGGPYHWRNGGCTAALYYNSREKKLEEDELYQPILRVAGALERGDTLLATTFGNENILPAAVEERDGALILFVQNRAPEETRVNVRAEGRSATFTAPGDSLTVCRILR